MKFLFFLCVFVSTCIHCISQDKTDFKYHLNHIGICVDFTTFNSLLSNTFISDAFSYTKIFKDSTGSEILVLGKEHYLQFYPDKGFFKNRVGACILYHHNFTWNSTNDHLTYLQSFTIDSLYNRPYTSADMNIDYINVKEDIDNVPQLLKFLPVLQNSSKEDYKKWGYNEDDLKKGIDQKRYMSDYVRKETAEKLFNSIHSIKVTISDVEKKKVIPLLKAYGYTKKGNHFLMDGSPNIYFEKERKTRHLKIRIKLSEQQPNDLIHISKNAFIKIKGNDAWFHYKVSEKNN